MTEVRTRYPGQSRGERGHEARSVPRQGITGWRDEAGPGPLDRSHNDDRRPGAKARPPERGQMMLEVPTREVTVPTRSLWAWGDLNPHVQKDTRT